MPKKHNWEEVRNNTSERPTLLNRLKESSKNFMKRIKDTFKPFPGNEEAWNSFPEETKKEMLESLKMKDNFDLFSLDLHDMVESWVSSMWDTTGFKEWIVQKDKIWKYIMINGIKCRKWEPGISGFTYHEEWHKYNSNANTRLTVWFCDKGKFTNSVSIDNKGKIKTIDLPNEIEDLLWGPFYQIEGQSINWPLSNISRQDIYSGIDENGVTPNRAKYSPFTHSRNWKQSKEWDSININWISFKPFKEGVSWFVYQEFWDKKDGILLAEYKNWKMVGEWVILHPNEKIYIKNKENLNK